MSGRYPNLGPGILLDAGITVIDDVGEEVFDTVTEGIRVQLVDNEVRAADGRVLATGVLLTPELLEEQLAVARAGLSDQIEAFADNTMEYLRQEKELLLEGVGVPGGPDPDRRTARPDRRPRL